VTASGSGPFRGRQAEARRNDELILDAALEVFAEDPQAPMSAVAERAGVGQASLYRRYSSRETLLARVCHQGMTRMREAALAAARSSGDPYDALAGFLRWYLESGTPRLGDLLGSFVPEEYLFDLARETNGAMQALVERAARAGRLREDVTGADLTLIVTQIVTLASADAERAATLRDRYLTLALQGLALRAAPELPGPPPDAAELEQPWRELQRGITPGSRLAESSRRRPD
jgi:AcrR family transcriptional regulator